MAYIMIISTLNCGVNIFAKWIQISPTTGLKWAQMGPKLAQKGPE